MTRLRATLSAVALVFALAAVAAAADAATVQVTIKNLDFTPAEITVHVGDTIEWINNDFVDHTATAKNGDWDVEIDANNTGKVTVTKAGVVPYFCQYHPDMLGTVTVLAN